MLWVFLLAYNEVYPAYDSMKYPYVMRSVANIQTAKIRWGNQKEKQMGIPSVM